MTFGPKLRLLLLRDAIYLAAVAGCFYLHAAEGTLVIALGALASTKYLEKPLRAAAPLLPVERREYFGFTAIGVLILLGLILAWAVRHSSPAAWTFGGLGAVVLLALLYAAYNSICGPNPRY